MPYFCAIQIGKPFAKVQDALEVTGKVVATLPKEKESAEVFFTTVESNLSRHSERQTEPGISLADSRSVAHGQPNSTTNLTIDITRITHA